MHRHGRPTRLTPALQAAIVAAVRQGVGLSPAALLAGLSPSTAREWVRRGEGDDPSRPPTPLYRTFALAVRTAQAEDVARRVLRINAAATGGAVVEDHTTTYPDGRTVRHVRYAEADWKADAFYLERRAPDEWGPKARVDVRLAIQQTAAKLATALGVTPEAILAEAEEILRDIDRSPHS